MSTTSPWWTTCSARRTRGSTTTTTSGTPPTLRKPTGGEEKNSHTLNYSAILKGGTSKLSRPQWFPGERLCKADQGAKPGHRWVSTQLSCPCIISHSRRQSCVLRGLFPNMHICRCPQQAHFTWPWEARGRREAQWRIEGRQPCWGTIIWGPLLFRLVLVLLRPKEGWKKNHFCIRELRYLRDHRTPGTEYGSI